MQLVKNRSLLLLLLCLPIIANAQETNFSQYYSQLAKLNQFNGNVIIAKNNNIIFQNTYNLNDIEDSFKVLPQSKFIIASVSKVFVKTAILKLQDKGKLKLSDSINKYIPDFPSGNKITIENLLLHKSGLPRELANYETYANITLNQAIELAKKEQLLFEPNTQTAYSNVGYFLLHYIIGKVSGKGYFKFMQEDIFNKLKLKNTFEYNNAKNKLNFANGFTNEDNKIEPTETKTIHQFETGNIITTVNDLYAFSQKIIASKFLSASSKSFLFHNDSMLVQAGGRKGYRSYLQINLKNKTTFILVSNQSDIALDEIIKETNNIIENKPFQLPKKSERKEIVLPDEVLRKYEGTYVSTEHKLNFTIKIMNNHLVAIEPNNSKTILYAEADNSFFDNPNSKDTYSFIINDKDHVIAFQILTTGIKINLEKQH
ncbi:MAG: serine hydrolase domain-containing protein [Chitinophagales bacterium]